MTWMDMSDALLEPAFQSSFDVQRRADDVDVHGRTQISWTTTPGVPGVVYPSGKNDLERLPDYQRAGKTISVITKFRLQGPSQDLQPDYVIWPSQTGDPYVVAHLEDYSQYGAGFILAICSTVELLPQPPSP